jgi:uncharacterized protein (TIGR02271 family)
MTARPILAGARVRTTDDLLGTVERIEGGDVAEESPGFLVIRERTGSHRYRVPLRLISTIGEEQDQSVIYTVVHLLIGNGDLDGYLLDEGERPATEDGTVIARIPLMEEQLTAETQPVRRGSVRLHKGVETHEQVLMVPLVEEEVTVERLSPDQYDGQAAADPDVTVIPVYAEELVVETRKVLVEYLQVRRRRITRQQEVRGLVRREVVSVTEQAYETSDQGDR